MSKLHAFFSVKSERKSNFELLRIISMLMIVASHWGWWSSAYPDLLQNHSQQMFHLYFRTFGQVGVILFVMISGYFLCKSKFKVTSLIKLIFQIFCSVCFLILLFFIRGYIQSGTLPVMGITTFTDWFIPISSGRWWFVSCYVLLFFISPFLNKMIELLKKSEFRILLIILFVSLSVIPSFFVHVNTTEVGQSIAGLIFIYLIGAYIRIYEEDFQNKWLCFCGAAVTFAIFIIGKKYGLAEYRYFIHVIALSVFIFLCFMHINIKSNFINLCAKTTFGVYLLHENAVVRFWLWNDVFSIQDYANTNLFIPVSVASVLITFLVCSIIDYVRQLTLEPLLMKLLKTKQISSLLSMFDSKMPENHLTPQSENKNRLLPIIILLSADILYLICELTEYFTQKAVSYKLFLICTVFILALIAFIRKYSKSKKDSLNTV